MTAPGSIHVVPPHPASLEVDILLHQCSLTRGRSQGPGGQHRNKVETKVTLVHLPTGVEAHAGERRSQEQNRQMAFFRLRLSLATRVRCPVDNGDARSPLWVSRVTTAGRIQCNPDHEDFPSLLALALDVLESCGWDVGKGALRLGCTGSQLLKMVQQHPPAFVVLSAARASLGLKALR
jgi:hypothetical protein